MAPEIPTRLGPYDVLGVIGSGAMGTVYKGYQPSLNRLVAIKVLTTATSDGADRVERFHREAQAVALLSHPNIVQVIDKSQDGDVLYFVMEYVDGTSLAERLKGPRLTLSEAVHVVSEVAKGLQYAHNRGVIHRDLSPRNILVSRDLAVVKLTDFGISRAEVYSAASGTLTGVHASLGSLYYCAPEQMANAAGVDHRADIYSLGVIAYEALTGKVPIGRFSLPSELNREVPLAIDPLVLKCLASDPAQRYSSAGAFLGDLNRVEEVAGVALARELKRLSPGRLFAAKATGGAPRSKRLIWMAGAVVLVVAAVVAGYVMSRRAAGPPPEATTAASGAAPASPVAVPEPPPPAANPAPDAPASGAPQGGAPPASVVTQSPVPAPARDVQAASPVAPQAAAPASAKAAPSAVKPPATPSKGGGAAARKAAEAQAQFASEAATALEAIKKSSPAPQRIAELRKFVAAYGATPSAPEAYLLMARAQEQVGQLQDAIATLGEVVIRHKDDPRAAEALLGQAQLLSKTKATPDEVRRRLAQVATDYRSSPSFVPAMIAKIALEDRLKIREFDALAATSVPSSLVTRRMLAEGAPQNPIAESTWWRVGEMYEELKRYALAAEAYTTLATRFPATKFDAWFAAAEIYERRLKDAAAARDAYSKVPASSPHYRDAQSRAQRPGK